MLDYIYMARAEQCASARLRVLVLACVQDPGLCVRICIYMRCLMLV